MNIYQQTPDFYNEYISHSTIWEGRNRYRNDEDELEHGWVRDAAAKAHKYIERWRGKNGKWYYRYKSKALESATKLANKAVGINDPRSVVNNKKPSVHWFPLLGSSKGRNLVGTDNGKSNSRSGQTGSRKITTTKVSYKVSRKPKKKGNITSRGYSGSQGSGESQRQRNLGTRHSSRYIFNTTKDVVKRGNRTYTLDKAGRAEIYNEWRKNPHRTIAKDAIENNRILSKSDRHSANKGYKRGKKKKR